MVYFRHVERIDYCWQRVLVYTLQIGRFDQVEGRNCIGLLYIRPTMRMYAGDLDDVCMYQLYNHVLISTRILSGCFLNSNVPHV